MRPSPFQERLTIGGNRGQDVAFHGQGDWATSCVRKQPKWMVEHAAQMCHHSFRVFDLQGRLLTWKRYDKEHELLEDPLLHNRAEAAPANNRSCE